MFRATVEFTGSYCILWVCFCKGKLFHPFQVELDISIWHRGKTVWQQIHRRDYIHSTMSILGLFCTQNKQECIPVGCVPAAHWPYAGVCFPGGGCLLLGVSARGGGIPACTEADTPPCEQNDRQVEKYYLGHNFVAACKNSRDIYLFTFTVNPDISKHNTDPSNAFRNSSLIFSHATLYLQPLNWAATLLF